MALEVDKYIGATGDLCSRLVGQGTSMLAERVDEYATVAGEVADALRERGEPQAADAASMLGTRTSACAEYLRSRDGRMLLDDFQSLTQERPWIAAGIGLLGGLVLARAVRASMRRDVYEESFSQPYVPAEGGA